MFVLRIGQLGNSRLAEVCSRVILYPHIFLIIFNPILEAIQSLTAGGLHLTIPSNNWLELLKVNPFMHVWWDEEISDETKGWYLAKVLAVHPDGEGFLVYRKKTSLWKKSIYLRFGGCLPKVTTDGTGLPWTNFQTLVSFLPYPIKSKALLMTSL